MTTFPIPLIGFRPPLVGLEASFNTIRLGRNWTSKLQVGQVVLLTDEKAKCAIGSARVERMDVERLGTLLEKHAAANHTQIGEPADAAHAARVMLILVRCYGPHIASPDRWATAIYLKRLK